MSMYRRAKKEESSKNEIKQLTIHLGSVTDDFDKLLAMCNDKSIELTKELDFGPDDKIEVVFWTELPNELIAISRFVKDKNGQVSFDLDPTETTL